MNLGKDHIKLQIVLNVEKEILILINRLKYTVILVFLTVTSLFAKTEYRVAWKCQEPKCIPNSTSTWMSQKQIPKYKMRVEETHKEHKHFYIWIEQHQVKIKV